jgi:hypothetical protein
MMSTSREIGLCIAGVTFWLICSPFILLFLAWCCTADFVRRFNHRPLVLL